MEEVPWLNLLDDVTEKILERLPLPDYIRFAAVCKHWFFIQCHHRLRHFPSPPPMSSLPWFITLDCQQDQDVAITCISPWERKSCRLELPGSALFSIFALSSSSGWLLMVDLDFSNSSSCCSIINPISKANITLPAGIIPADPPLVSSPPRSVIFVPVKRLLFMLKLDLDNQAWSQLQLPKLVTSAATCRRRLYCISSELDFFIVDPVGPTVQLLDMDRNEVQGLERQLAILVESDEEVLLVVYVLIGSLGVVKGFRVFSADVCGKKWVKVGSIGERVVVIDAGCGVSLVAEEGKRGNCIYFRQQLEIGGPCLWMVFDLGSGVVSDTDDFNWFTRDCMFMPSLC